MSTQFKNRLQADGEVVSIVPLAATGGDISGGSAGGGVLFTWPTVRRIARIVKSATCQATLSVAFNRDTRETGEWDEQMGPDERRLTITRVRVNSLTIWSDEDLIYGQDFVVYGWA